MGNGEFDEDIDPSGRVSLIPAGNMLLPATCAMCGKSGYDADEKFLDIRLDIPDFGVVYFCRECGQEIGYAAGCARKSEFEAIAIANEQLTEENTKYESMLERLGDGLERDLLDWLSSRGISVPNNSDSGVSSSDVSESPESDDEFLYGGVGTTGVADERTTSDNNIESADVTESVTVERPNDADESTDSDNTSEPESSYKPLIEL